MHRLSHPNILLITVEALRADHLGCYGYKRDTSPNIDRLAKEGTVFLNCFITSPGVATHSFVSFLTGRYLKIAEGNMFFNNVLDKDFTTLAEYLKRAGYYAAAFITNPTLKVNKGFERGFDSYKMFGSLSRTSDAQKVTGETLEFLNDYHSDKPLFLWVHYVDPHVPYINHERYSDMFKDDALYRENDRTLELNRDPGAHPFLSEGYIPKKAFHEDRYDLNYYIACYDSEIRYADFYIGELLKKMKDGNTVVVLSSDHGEALGEHNVYFHHGENIYDEVLRVPLIIKDSRYFKGGEKISASVSTADIVPTILNMASPFRYLLNKNRFDGEELVNMLKGKDDNGRRFIYSYFPGIASIRDVKKNNKYILNQNGKEELYFLPDENTDRIKDDSPSIIQIRGELRGNLKNWLRHYPVRSDMKATRISLDEENKKELKAMGYLQ
ncbi:MAG: sulfatase [Candidatus Omnitrophica bacterium]|nr:sulfatase [Candidatus Omnitrophota bacterium]MDD5553792.1 sulfatase [Candidatus Omnitrophota bacterium]